MTIQTEITDKATAMKTIADEIVTLASQIDQPPAPDPLVFPPGVDCLGGTIPSPVAMVPAEQDIYYFDTKRNFPLYRLHRNTPPGSVLFYGDSILEGMNIAEVTPFGANHAISGNTLRGVLKQLIDAPSIHTSSAVVLLIGINDMVHDAGPFRDIPFMMQKIAGWATGKWIIVNILPINEALFHPVTKDVMDNIGVLDNGDINTANGLINAVFANHPSVTMLNLKAQLAPAGQLLGIYSDDGIHLNAAGYTILKANIKSLL